MTCAEDAGGAVVARRGAWAPAAAPVRGAPRFWDIRTGTRTWRLGGRERVAASVAGVWQVTEGSLLTMRVTMMFRASMGKVHSANGAQQMPWHETPRRVDAAWIRDARWMGTDDDWTMMLSVWLIWIGARARTKRGKESISDSAFASAIVIYIALRPRTMRARHVTRSRDIKGLMSHWGGPGWTSESESGRVASNRISGGGLPKRA